MRLDVLIHLLLNPWVTSVEAETHAWFVFLKGTIKASVQCVAIIIFPCLVFPVCFSRHPLFPCCHFDPWHRRAAARDVCRRQCLGVSGSISMARSRLWGPLLSSSARGTTVDQRSGGEERAEGFLQSVGDTTWAGGTAGRSPLLKALTPCGSPLAWQVSFLPGSSLIIARFWFQWHQFTSSTLRKTTRRRWDEGRARVCVCSVPETPASIRGPVTVFPHCHHLPGPERLAKADRKRALDVQDGCCPLFK